MTRTRRVTGAHRSALALSLVVVAVVASALPASLTRRAVAATVPSLPKPVVAGETIELPVLGQGGVPATGVDAVVLTVTAVDATAETFITAWPSGEARPVASSLNPGVRRTAANTVVVKVGANGKIAFYNNAGAVQIIVDLLGWIGQGASLHMQSSARVFDSRDVGTALKADSTTNVTIAGRAGVPVDASAAVVNLTATGASSESYLSAWPAGAARPAASNVNPVAGRTVANLAVVPIGAGGAISLYNHAGTVDAIVDVLGWLDAAGGVTLAPSTRLLDTRPTATPLGPDAIAEIGVAVPAVAGATAPVGATVPTPSRGVSTGDVGVIVNITAAEASAATYLTVWPSGGARPATSTLNPSPGPAQANTVLLGIGSLAAGSGSIALANHSGRVHVIVDLLGVLSPVAGFHALAPTRLLDTRPPDVHHAFPVSLAASPPPSYVRDHHDYPATDIFAACGTPVLAPVDGTIVHVRRIDRYDPAVGNPATLGGRSIAIVGDDGVRYYGSHLDTFVDGIAVGVRVAAGQPLATVGKTGDAGACHLHFGLSPLCPSVEWSVRRGVIWPWPYLDSWRVGGNLSPVPEIASWFGAHGNACAAASALATAPDSEDPAAPAAAALRYGAR